MQLVIAEKPSVAKNIAEVLGATSFQGGFMEGNDYVVLLGVILDLDCSMFSPLISQQPLEQHERCQAE